MDEDMDLQHSLRREPLDSSKRSSCGSIAQGLALHPASSATYAASKTFRPRSEQEVPTLPKREIPEGRSSIPRQRTVLSMHRCIARRVQIYRPQNKSSWLLDPPPVVPACVGVEGRNINEGVRLVEAIEGPEYSRRLTNVCAGVPSGRPA